MVKLKVYYESKNKYFLTNPAIFTENIYVLFGLFRLVSMSGTHL